MPETLTSGRAGLMTTQAAPVPLTGVTIDAEISVFCARVSVTQRYVNREDKPIEAVYLFPLDEGAAVCGFEAVIDGTLVVGEVREREEAFRMYDDAMTRGDGAFLLDEERPDVFQASVGNLPPGKEVLLKLTYVTELGVDGNALRFAIPTTVAPRYAPARDQRGVGRPDSEALSAPTEWRVPYGLNLSVRLAMNGTITRLESPSHPIAVGTNGTTATVSLSQRDAALDRDFVLSVEAEGLDTPQTWIERGEDGTEAIAVGFVPRLSDQPAPAEVIFLVDRSGSMDGTSIAEVRNALQLCLRSLTSGCLFNIVGFGSRMEVLFDGSRAYDDDHLEKASRYVEGLQADFGGTEILPALSHILEAPTKGLFRQVLVLTDGQVTNTDAVIGLAHEHRTDARIFTFGIGAGASHHLVRGLARAGRGAAEFIYPGERLEPKVLRQFGRLLAPALNNVRVDWGSLKVKQAPTSVPPVFAGSRMLVYAFVEGRVTDANQVTLAADTSSNAITFRAGIDPVRIAQGRTVATLAARARIRELEESPEWTTAHGSRQQHRKAPSVSKEIVELGTKYGLMSRETSYVAIERRKTPVQGDVQLRRVPIALTAGWGALQERATGRMVLGAPLTARSGPAWKTGSALSLSWPPDEGAAQPDRASGWISGVFQRAHSMVDWKRPKAQRGSTESITVAPMQALVLLQRADGSWDLTQNFAAAIGQPLSVLEAAVNGTASSRVEIRRTWATALAIAWLQEHASDVEDEWRMLSAKARRWLEGVGVPAGGGGEWTERAAKFLRGLSAPVTSPGD